MKRTYNLSEAAVATVRGAVERGGAPTQDAFVEAAIALLARRQEEDREAAQWEDAARDPEFMDEIHAIEVDFARHDATVME